MPVNSEQDSCSFPVIVLTQKRSIVGKIRAATALRDIDDLVERGILAKDAAGGRSTSYSLVETETSEDD